ncbi:Coiled-coil and C2 domain-containing protein 1B [Nowakowskiella sp. JEL0078]|nr:Coiled-coil and C2 domain-containing protein 1B [Nowakowskiella sp. JEL0078]
MSRAKEMVATFKSLQENLEIVNLGGTLPSSFKMPPHPSEIASFPSPSPSPLTITSASTASLKTKPSSQKQPSKKPITAIIPESLDLSEDLDISLVPKDLFTHLETRLSEQISLCTSIAAHYYKKGKKEKALEYHKSKKSMAADLEVLRSLGATPGATPPPFRYVSIQYEIEQAFPEIAVNEIELSVLRAFDLGSREVQASEVDSYVSFDMGFENAAEGKGDTGVIKKNPNPEYKFSKKMRIERTRAFERYLSRKKCSFEVFHHRGIFALLGAKTSLGKASIDLKTLLTKCEIQQVIELMDPVSGRKPTGGKLEVQLRLRTPLQGSDVVTKSERWLEIDFGDARSSSSSVATLAKSETKEVLSPSRVVTPVKEIPAKQTPTIVKDTPVKQSPLEVKEIPLKTPVKEKIINTEENENAEIEAEIAKYYDAGNIISNVVLETEVQQIAAQINSLESAKTDIPSELVDRKTAYEERANLLVLMVQLGRLSMEEFVSNLDKSIAATKQHAVSFKRFGRMDMAKAALVRVKQMEKEVDEVRKMMEEEEEED